MSISICKFFKSEQGCKFGNKCRNKHSTSSSLPYLNLSEDQKQNEDSVRKRPDPSETKFKEERYQISSTSVENDTVKVPVENLNQVSTAYLRQSSNNGSAVSLDNSSDILETSLHVKFQEFQLHSNTSVNDETVTSSYNQPSQQKSTKRICHYFSRYGNCCFGNRCRFEHAFSYRPSWTFQQVKNDFRTSAAGSHSQNDSTKEQKGVRYSEINSDESLIACSANSHAWLPSAESVLAGKLEPTAEQAITQTENVERNGEDSNARNRQVRSGKLCQFYITGKCWRGKRCKFLHPNYEADIGNKRSADLQTHTNNSQALSKESENHQQAKKLDQSTDCEVASKSTPARQTRPVYVAQGVKKYQREEIDDVTGSRLRRTEIDQLMKRFPKSKVKVNRDCAEYFQCIISFSPTDPDWPFDVRVFQLQVDIPADYPLEMLTISLPAEQNLPETVRRYLEVSIEEWLEDREKELADKGKVQLVFRPFLHWLDRNIEDIVTEGLKQLKREMVAKAAGLEFISAKQLQKQYPGTLSDDSDDTADEEEEEGSIEEEESGSQDDDVSTDYEESEEERPEEERHGGNDANKKSQQEKMKGMLAEPDRRGTEISLKNLQLKESAATLHFEKICLSVQCERCKGTSEFTASAGRVNVVQCGQCGLTQIATYRPAMVHQFSAVIGYLDLESCLPFDVILQNSNVVISCMHCSKESKPGAVLPGQVQDHWCRVCHRKLRISTDGVRFTQLEPSRNVQSLTGAVKVVVPTRKRIPKDPAIQEGKPLPNFGTCKHYKKSYRWLRFPCCGKCYPCDICHDSKEDHEMKYANRMICGFCCKEQAYAAEKPCKGCDMNMTKVHTIHWEGGQGCRDKITMCSNDKQKYCNLSKTTSKHAQKVKDMQSKKKTKLRHT